MKILRLLLVALLVIAASTFSKVNVSAQQKTSLPPALNDSSSLVEILDWLDKNAFPYARVGLKRKGHTGPRGQFGLPTRSVSGGERIFSKGFHLKSVNGCNVILSNEHPEIIAWQNQSSGPFYRFTPQKNGTRQLTPQLALLFLQLDRASDRKGKGSFLHTKDPDKAKLVGTWRTQFQQKGFFSRVLFEAQLTSAEEPQTKELNSFQYLTFTFDSQELAEQFNTAFRRAITICGKKK